MFNAACLQVAVIRRELADPRTVLAGFLPVIECELGTDRFADWDAP
jgi:hypothetical protein